MIKILIVEDNMLELDYCKMLLQKLDICKIYRAATGQQALCLLELELMDAIFLDIKLPDIDGYKLAGEIRTIKRYHLVPIVFLTDRVCEDYETIKKYRNYAYIRKPYDKELFNAQVLPLLQGIQARKKPYLKDSIIKVNTKSGPYIIRLNEILFAEVHNKKLTIYTIDNIIKGINMNLCEFKELVSIHREYHFEQCYKSCIVNLQRISCIKEMSKKTWEISFDMNNTIKCPLSISYKANIFTYFKECI